MCESCYQDYESPRIITEQTIEAGRLISAVYRHHAAGGNAHSVLDDWNLEDSSINFCLEYIKKNEDGDSEEKLRDEKDCLELLLTMTEQERASALAMFDGYLK